MHACRIRDSVFYFRRLNDTKKVFDRKKNKTKSKQACETLRVMNPVASLVLMIGLPERNVNSRGQKSRGFLLAAKDKNDLTTWRPLESPSSVTHLVPQVS